MDKSILRKALADSPDPTPGYLFRDITAMTFVDETTQQKLIAYLTKELHPKSSVHVLAKTLKVIKVLCETGHQDFQKEMQRQADFLKQFAQYRGVPDTKFGDAYNDKVRNNAKEAIEAAFSARKEAKLQIGAGLGNTATEDTSSKGPSFTTGINISTGATNNPNIANMPTTNKWAEEQAARQKGLGTSQLVQNVKAAVSTGFGVWKEPVKTDEERMREAMYGGSHSEFRPVELPTAGFGGAGFGPGPSAGASDWKFGEEASAATATTETRLLTPIQKEVERICSYKNSPQRVDLSQFLQVIQAAVETSGSWEDVAEALDAKLPQSCPWQQRLNSLTCIEHLIRSAVSGEFNAYFVENPEDIHRNVFVVQNSLKEKAQKVLKLLGIPERTATSAAPAQQTMSFSGNTQWSEAMPAVAPSAGGDLDLGGMTVKSRRGNANATKAPEEDKTKLRKRAAMTVAPVEEAQPAQGGFAQGGGFGSAGGWGNTSDGWGTTTTSGANDGWGTTTTAGNDGWGTSNDGWGVSTAPAAAAPAAAPATAPHSDMDAFFGAAPAPAPQRSAPAQAVQPAWGSSAAAPAPSNAVTLDFLDQVIPAAPSQPPPQPQPQFVQPAPFASAPPAAAAPAAAPAASGIAAMLAQQQQMMQMLNSQMQQVMVSNADPAIKQQQIAMIMQQQQQMMTMMQTLQAQVAGTPSYQQPAPAARPPQQHQQATHQHNFAQLNDEMKRSMGF